MGIGEAFPAVLAAARLGEPWAWSELYREFSGPVTGYLTTRGGAEPDDLVSETFLQVARGIHDFVGDESQFRSWVFVIAHRRLQDERRSRGRRPRTVPLDDGGGDAFAQLRGGDVEVEAMARLGGERVEALLDALTPSQRDVIMLRVVGELSLEQASQALGKPVGAVKALQHRAMKALQSALAEGPDADSRRIHEDISNTA